MERLVARILLAVLVLEVSGIYLTAWLESGTADPRCAFVPTYVPVHVIGANGTLLKCKPRE
jgi:hypothetical protein